MPLKLGLLGAGNAVRNIHLPGFRLLPGVEVACYYDPGRETLDGVARVESAAEVLDRCDAVVIATPNHEHHRQALAAFGAGKHVLCEKPLALNAVQAGEMLAAARDAGQVHMTAFTYQYAPAVNWLRSLVRQGALGEIRTVRAAYLMALSAHLLGWRSESCYAGSGVLADIGSHLIHVTRFATGLDIASITATKQRFREDPKSDVEDWIAFLAHLGNGGAATFEISRVCPGRGAAISEEMFVEVYGSQGSAVMSLQDPWALSVALGEDGRDPSRPLTRLDVPAEFLKIPGSPRDPHQADRRWGYRYDQAFQFAESIRLGKSRTPTLEDGVRCQAIMDAALASCDTHQWTEVPA